jgi:two-component system OmpR family response regulator
MTNAAPKKIFIVDDDDMFKLLLSTHLKRNENNTIRVFSTGEACLEALSENPDIIVLDYNLNSVAENAADGMQILQAIKKRNHRIHVIMLSSQESYGTALKTITKGAEQYVIKSKAALEEIETIIAQLN